MKVVHTFDYDNHAKTNHVVRIDTEGALNESSAVLDARQLMATEGWSKAQVKYGVGEIEINLGDNYEGQIKAMRHANSAVTLLGRSAPDRETGALVDVRVKKEFADDAKNLYKIRADIAALAQEQGRSLRYVFQGVAGVVEKPAGISPIARADFKFQPLPKNG